MEVVISVSKAELEESASGKTSPIEGTVKSLLSIDTSPTLELLEKIKRGRIAHLLRYTPEGKLNRGLQTYKVTKQPKPDHYNK